MTLEVDHRAVGQAPGLSGCQVDRDDRETRRMSGEDEPIWRNKAHIRSPLAKLTQIKLVSLLRSISLRRNGHQRRPTSEIEDELMAQRAPSSLRFQSGESVSPGFFFTGLLGR